MIERRLAFLMTRLPPKIETAVGMAGTAIYGIAIAAPAEFQEVFEKIPISGWLIGIMAEADLRMSAGALTIAFGVIAFDGFKRILNERFIDTDNQG